MDKYKVVLIVGPSGSGKDTLAKGICENNPKFNYVITATTRPMRENEINGKNYHFLTELEFERENFVEETVFNGWRYGTPFSSLSSIAINIIVCNPAGMKSLLNHPMINVLHVYMLKTKDKIRMERQLHRETSPMVGEIVRRWSADWEDFSNLDQSYSKDERFVKLKNNNGYDIVLAARRIMDENN